ncbi:MAG TPA: carboxymuconolactone decarboxylase family protein [Myxococcales bacterium]|nr:carboxymuconolactone decarboxylase family protein [Myxococcales bacterium]
MTTPNQRLRYPKVAPDAYRAMIALEDYVHSTGLELALLELVKIRASYLNGCAFCIDMHTKDARAEGETEQRIYAVPVWRETPFFTPRERAALAWTEAVTELGRDGVPDDVYAEARAHFEEAELVRLTMAVVVINGWNRLSIAFRTEVGGYQPTRRKEGEFRGHHT